MPVPAVSSRNARLAPWRAGLLAVAVLLLLALGVGSRAAWAQGTSPLPTLGEAEGPPPARLILDPRAYQIRADGRTLSEGSGTATLIVPVGRRLQVSASTAYALIGGDLPTSVGGLRNTEVNVTYAQPLGATSLVTYLGGSLPSGRVELSRDEILSTARTGQTFYGFPAGTLGTGWSVAPGAAFAFPVREALSFSVGATYRYQGAYKPLAGVTGSYDPGNEISVSLGSSARLSQDDILAMDATYTRFGQDEVDGLSAIDSGDQVTLTARYQRRLGYNTLEVVGRYEGYGRSDVPAQVGATADSLVSSLRLVPQQGFLSAAYRARLNERVFLGGVVEARAFGRVEGGEAGGLSFDPQQFVTLRATPEFVLTRAVTLAPEASVTLGSFLGYGGGLRVIFSR
jgi:hypothetical protein